MSIFFNKNCVALSPKMIDIDYLIYYSLIDLCKNIEWRLSEDYAILLYIEWQA